MKAKTKEKEEARALRRDGSSIKEIAESLNVAQSSVSVWVRDIKLSHDQEKTLKERCAKRKTKKEQIAKKENINSLSERIY